MSLIYDPNFESLKNQESTYTDNGWTIESIKKSDYFPAVQVNQHPQLATVMVGTPDFNISFYDEYEVFLEGGGPFNNYAYRWYLSDGSLAPHMHLCMHWNATFLPESEGGVWPSSTGGENAFLPALINDNTTDGGYAFKLAAVSNKLYAYVSNESNEIPYECTICSRGTFDVVNADAYGIDFRFKAIQMSNIACHTRMDLFIVEQTTGNVYFLYNHLPVYPNQLVFAEGEHPTNSTDLLNSLEIEFIDGVCVYKKYFAPGTIPAGTYKLKIKFYTGYTALLDHTWFQTQGTKFEFHKCNFYLASAYPVIHELEMGGNQGSAPLIDFNGTTPLVVDTVSPTGGLESFVYPLWNGWDLFGIPLDLTTIEVGHNAHPTKTSSDLGADNGIYSLTEFLYNHLYYSNSEIDTPVYYLPPDYSLNGQSLPGAGGGNPLYMSNWYSTVIIAKDYLGAAYLPQFDFNGVGNLSQFEGYQLKVGGPLGHMLELRYSGQILYDETINSTDVLISLPNGWFMLAYPSLTPTSASAFFEPLTSQNELIICKDFLGAAYLPEWNFNGVGNLIPGRGYQIKLTGQ